MGVARHPTPDPIARQLRQEAGFGCCKCGYPIVQYHHIVPYAGEPHFRPSDMMALCPNCHSEATSGALTAEKQRFHKTNPVNLQRGFAQGLLTINEVELRVALGGNEFLGGGSLIIIENEPVIALQMNDSRSLDLSIKLYDESDNVLLEISRNEWLSGDPLPWDIEAGYQTLSIRRKKGKVALDLDCRRCPIEMKGLFWRSSRLVKIGPSSMSVDHTALNTMFSGCTFQRTCLSLEMLPQPKVTIRPNVDR